MNKYQSLALQLKQQICEQIWRSGEKIPSVRACSRQAQVSTATVLQAYQLLETEGWLVAKPQSGYLVATNIRQVIQAEGETPPPDAPPMRINDLLYDVFQRTKSSDFMPFSSAFPEANLFPQQELVRSLASASRKMKENSALTNLPPGSYELRRLIAQRYVQQGLSVKPDDIVITTGGLEALNLSLQAVTQPGDYVAIESPTFYGALQAIERLKLIPVEIPASVTSGLDLDVLEEKLAAYPIKACWLMTNFQNPLGYSLSNAQKQRLVSLLNRHEAYLIEDDVYSELYFSEQKPLPAKAFDPQDRVLLCSSFSKCLSPGFRIGWVVAGKLSDQIQRQQFLSTISSSVPAQLGISHYLLHGGYDNHLRKLRTTLQHRKTAMITAIKQAFPKQTQVSDPDGGYVVWLSFPPPFDCQKFYELASQANIAIAPGTIFSLQQDARQHIRLNYSYPLNPKTLTAINTLGDLAARCLRSESEASS
ncbi:PLP-dependent aminotransferase family protein [Photobacterium sp. 1_MG-2023]|uniref:aminotransferase-like domain-containing protein n=1 Tax=Photobacterium sp. 1_MG-2023 TaxID=3062646 RepID=UPI0026E3A2FA|nr:PLP-dependent aminotransferase family protein [Photobacterium sp. 1_MG-2023]MDO6708171.1 PLP-dependent aminotransferase family protein [Photobacterium sp. 1_MG-2023]